ncbi:MAG: 30S ribosomal protein S1 [Deltaproteobacteria bacterium]|nr:30S ribosomal protein S1 [Deltaproteobacteria bacterium]
MSNISAGRDSEFARLFEESFRRTPIQEGEIIKGTVVRITKDYVVIDIGFKSEGQVPIEEFRDPQGQLTCQVGDVVDVFVESIEDDEGLLVLSKERASMMRTWDRLVEAADQGTVVEGTVVGKVKGGLSVDIGVKAFLPRSQIDIRPIKSLDKYAGKVFRLKIIKLNKKRGNVVVSRKLVLEKERESMRTTTLQNLQEGQILEGVVKNITDYGVFVDLGGLDGLLHVTDMSWGRVNHPSEMFEVGDDLRVKVLRYDDKTERVSLGYKQLQADPWQGVDERFAVGARVRGKIVNVTDYGAFVELEKGVEGLIHVSEMSWGKKAKHPSKVVTPGEQVDAIVLDVDGGNRRIALGLKQLMTNPWENLSEKFSVGTRVTGTVRNVADFGIFLDVGAEVDALAHISDLCWVQTFASPGEIYQKGAQVEGCVLHIDAEQERFAVGLKQLQDDPWPNLLKQYQVGTSGSGKVVRIGGLGPVVELAPGIEGVIPQGEVTTTPAVGTAVEVKITRCDPKERRLYLQLA